MKLSCTQENLNKGLSIVSHIASKNISLPILNNVLLKTENGVLKLSTTNLEMGITCDIRSKIEKEGSFTVSAKLLHDYISLLPNERVDIELKNNELELNCKNSKTVIKGIAAAEFPLIPSVSSKDVCRIKTSGFRKALSGVAFAVAFDETRPEISGVYFNFEKDKLIMVATDSYRLAEKAIEVEKPFTENKSVIVPIKTVQELIRILGEGDETITIYINENQILFTFNGVNLVSRIIEGQYPDYKQIIPKEFKTKVTINTQELIKTIKAVSLFCRSGVNDVSLKFLPDKKEVNVSATNIQLGENITRIDGEVEGEENNIVFNYRYLIEGVQNINTEDSVLEINSSMNPGVLKPKDEDNYLYIIMPIKQ